MRSQNNMADKNELKQAAFELAVAELRGRVIFDEYRSGEKKITEVQLQQFREQAEKARAHVEAIRKEVPDIAGKSYWWDVPYDMTKPAGNFPDTFLLPDGIYTEQEDFEETDGFLMERGLQYDTTQTLFEFYLSNPNYVVLYADRKRLKANLGVPVQRNVILCAKEELPTHRQVGAYQGERPYDVTKTWEYQHLKSEAASIAGRLPGELQEYEEWHDNAERFMNALFDNSIFTNKERWLMGEMDSDSYYTSEMYRDLRRMEKQEKAQEKISQMEWQMKQMRERAARVQAQYQKYELERAKAKLDKGVTLRFMRCGYAFYLENALAALVLINRTESVFKVHHSGTISPYDIFGRIGDCREVLREVPNPAPFVAFALEQYGSRIKPYSPLALRPKNASDELWRYWAERRLEEFLLSANP